MRKGGSGRSLRHLLSTAHTHFRIGYEKKSLRIVKRSRPIRCLVLVSEINTFRHGDGVEDA